MFFRLNKSGERGFTCKIVENKRDSRKSRQRVIANVGRADELAASSVSPLSSLPAPSLPIRCCSSTRSTRTPKALLSVRPEADRWADAVRPDAGAARRRHCPDPLLKERAFEFPVERAVFIAAAASAIRLGIGSRDCWSWMEDYDIPGAEGARSASSTALMAWLGEEEVEEKPEEGRLAPALRQGRDRREAVRPPPQSIHRPLHRIHGHHQPLLLRRGRRDARRARLLQDYRPDLKQMILGLVVDGDGRLALHRDVAGKHRRRRDRHSCRWSTACGNAFHRPGLRRRRPRHDLGRNHRRAGGAADSEYISRRTRALKTPSYTQDRARERRSLSCPPRRAQASGEDATVRQAGEGRRRSLYVVCRNEAEAENDRKDREAIVAALDAQLKKRATRR